MAELVEADLSNSVHAEAVLGLLDLYARDIMGGGEELSEFTRDNLISELSERENCHIALAFEGGAAAGIAICFEAFSTFACRPILNIHDFAVAPEFRGKGLARALLSFTEEIALRLGCCKLTLEVLEGNERAQCVYRSFGFRGYELDPKMGRALFMDKPLESADEC